MTEIQQGANKAIAPAMTAASTEPPKKMLLLILSHHFQEAGTRCPAILPPTVSSALPVPPLSGTSHCLSFGDDRDLRAFDLGNVPGGGFLLSLHTRQAGFQFSQLLIARQPNSRHLIPLHLSGLRGGRLPIPGHAAHHEQHRERACR